jgi:hypothetical protein
LVFNDVSHRINTTIPGCDRPFMKKILFLFPTAFPATGAAIGESAAIVPCVGGGVP